MHTQIARMFASTGARRAMVSMVSRASPFIRITHTALRAPSSPIHQRSPLSTTRSLLQQSPTTPNTYTMSTLDEAKYHDVSTQAMESLTEFLEDMGDEMDITDYDIEYTSGVLTLRLGEKGGTYVINKQPPNKQIWLSSPFSGPERYDYDMEKGAWFCRHSGESLGTLLGREISQALGVLIEVPIK
ncbi:Mitochondrial matrix iron chaperone [Kickxella alabastrina]|nr:Mitochondrial matrix iron chaperone [Kickxella alabastrina]